MKQNLVFPISLFKYIMFTFIRKIKEDGILITIITRINLSAHDVLLYMLCLYKGFCARILGAYSNKQGK